jgi:AmmeMemoRadiSam system protein A
VELARAAIQTWVRERRLPDENEHVDLREKLQGRGAAFVSLKKRGDLRGCIGTFQPLYKSLADEIINNAVSAASRDPRFPPVGEEELDDLEISVDVLSEPEPVSDLACLDPRRYGVIVQAGRRIGLLLPDLEGVDSVDEQLQIARRKAGIGEGEAVQIYRFTVNRFH